MASVAAALSFRSHRLLALLSLSLSLALALALALPLPLALPLALCRVYLWVAFISVQQGMQVQVLGPGLGPGLGLGSLPGPVAGTVKAIHGFSSLQAGA